MRLSRVMNSKGIFEAGKNGKAEEFIKAHGCDATLDEIKAFLEKHKPKQTRNSLLTSWKMLPAVAVTMLLKKKRFGQYLLLELYVLLEHSAVHLAKFSEMVMSGSRRMTKADSALMIGKHISQCYLLKKYENLWLVTAKYVKLYILNF